MCFDINQQSPSEQVPMKKNCFLGFESLLEREKLSYYFLAMTVFQIKRGEGETVSIKRTKML